MYIIPVQAGLYLNKEIIFLGCHLRDLLLQRRYRVSQVGYRGVPENVGNLMVLLPHCCRRGPRFDLNFQQKFKWLVNLWWKCYQKIQKRNILTEGPTLEKLGF